MKRDEQRKIEPLGNGKFKMITIVKKEVEEEIDLNILQRRKASLQTAIQNTIDQHNSKLAMLNNQMVEIDKSINEVEGS